MKKIFCILTIFLISILVIYRINNQLTFKKLLEKVKKEIQIMSKEDSQISEATKAYKRKKEMMKALNRMITNDSRPMASL